MPVPAYSGQFKRDVERMQRRGKDMEKLKKIVRLLLSGRPLPSSLKDHPLKGEWVNFRDLHIEPDWLLIYKPMCGVVRFERTGTHADLFEE